MLKNVMSCSVQMKADQTVPQTMMPVSTLKIINEKDVYLSTGKVLMNFTFLRNINLLTHNFF